MKLKFELTENGPDGIPAVNVLNDRGEKVAIIYVSEEPMTIGVLSWHWRQTDQSGPFAQSIAMDHGTRQVPPTVIMRFQEVR